MLRKILAAGAVALAALMVLAGCGGGSTTTTGAPSGAARTISGAVSYAGAVSPTHQVVIVATRQGEQAPAYSAVLQKSGAYSFSGVTDGTYSVLAFMDLGDDMGAPKSSEPQGFYDRNADGTPDTVVMAGGQSVTGVDITLIDR